MRSDVLAPSRAGTLRPLYCLRLRDKFPLSLCLNVRIELNRLNCLIYIYSWLRLTFPYIFGPGRACNYLQARVNQFISCSITLTFDHGTYCNR